ncbi:uroporphyrinogen-III C-methyltransferase, partial [Salmonella enterica]|uniref:uroporphyrinogen-III C-methyltransferase n=1 Tax=Salmonella enterica TaxID=28901 RepID=UPI0021B0EFAD
ALDNVSTWVRAYYDTDDAATKAFLEEVDKLSQQNITMDLPETLGSQAICQRLVRYGRGDISIRNQTAPDGLSGTVVTIHFLHENGGRDGDNSSTG